MSETPGRHTERMFVRDGLSGVRLSCGCGETTDRYPTEAEALRAHLESLPVLEAAELADALLAATPGLPQSQQDAAASVRARSGGQSDTEGTRDSATTS